MPFDPRPADTAPPDLETGPLWPDPAACVRLRGMHDRLMRAMPAALAEVYAQLRREPKMAALLGDADRIRRLQSLQESHWSSLLSASFGDAYVARTVRVGEVHAGIGLEPRLYVGGMFLVVEQLVTVLTRQHRAGPALAGDLSALLRVAFLDMELSLRAWHVRSHADHLVDEVRSLADLIETDVGLVVGEISLQAERLADGAMRLASVAGDVRGIAEAVDAAASATVGSVEAVMSAAQMLEASTGRIAGQAAHAADATAASAREAGAAGQSMHVLARSAEEIGGIVRLVRGIAQQTRMLALNAAIEATRAGDAGRSFAVVAAEVKGLAGQTEAATDGVSTQAEAIIRGVAGAARQVGGIGERATDVEAIAHEVCNAATEQSAATVEITRQVGIADLHTRAVAEQARTLLEQAEATEAAASGFGEMAAQLRGGLAILPQRLSTLLRSSPAGSRRRTERTPVCIRFTLLAGGRTVEGFTGDLSVAGALLAVTGSEVTTGAEGRLVLDRLGELRVRVVCVSAIGLHVQFLDPPDAVRQAITACLVQARAQDPHYVALCQNAAAQAAAAFEQAIASGRFSLQAVFDTAYLPVPGTDPQQHVCAATGACDALLATIIEPVKVADPAIALCAACDRNGYIATHNRDYSHPQRPGEPLWNFAHSRNRRIFGDRTGLLAARNTRPILIQAYPRDMGGGKSIMLKEYDAPIIVHGRHWGAMRLAVKLSAA